MFFDHSGQKSPLVWLLGRVRTDLAGASPRARAAARVAKSQVFQDSASFDLAIFITPSTRMADCVSSGWVVTRVLCLLWTGAVKAENRSDGGVCLLWTGRGEAADGSDGGVCLLWTGRGEAENSPSRGVHEIS